VQRAGWSGDCVQFWLGNGDFHIDSLGDRDFHIDSEFYNDGIRFDFGVEVHVGFWDKHSYRHGDGHEDRDGYWDGHSHNYHNRQLDKVWLSNGFDLGVEVHVGIEVRVEIRYRDIDSNGDGHKNFHHDEHSDADAERYIHFDEHWDWYVNVNIERFGFGNWNPMRITWIFRSHSRDTSGLLAERRATTYRLRRLHGGN